MQLLNPEIDLWLYKNDIPKDLKLISDNNEKDLKTVITENVQRKVQENKDVDVENILSILPLRHRRGIMRRLRLASLRKVPMLQNMDMIVLDAFCMHLKPMIYAEDSYIIPEEEPLEKMLFITHGTAWTYATNRLTSDGFLGTKSLERGDFYGEELLMWALNSTSVSDLPISTRIVKSQTKVEAFVIRAKDLKTVVAKFWWYFSRILDPLEEIQRVKWQNLAAASIIEKWRYYHPHPGKHNGRKLDVMRQFKSN